MVAAADAAGNSLAINGYDAWGIPNAANVGRFQYTGQAWLPELGMYYYKARIYSPTLGRFMQTDPVGYQGGINLYAYVHGDPVNSTDPSGLTCTTSEGKDGGTRYHCQIDKVIIGRNRDGTYRLRDPTDRERRSFQRFERAYSRAVERLMANPNRTRSITVPGEGPRADRTFQVSARQTAEALIARTFMAAPNGRTSGDGWMATDAQGTAVLGGALNATGLGPFGSAYRTVQVGIVHEGIHRTAPEMGMRIFPDLDQQPYQSSHQDPYNQAASGILGHGE